MFCYKFIANIHACGLATWQTAELVMSLNQWHNSKVTRLYPLHVGVHLLSSLWLWHTHIPWQHLITSVT